MSELMSCPHCGRDMSITPELRGQTVTCPHCQKELSIPPPMAQPVGGAGAATEYRRTVGLRTVKNYLVEAILVTLFCCQPFGIVAIVYAAQVDGKLSGGDYAVARQAAEKAKNWCLASMLCGLAAILAGIVIALAAQQ